MYSDLTGMVSPGPYQTLRFSRDNGCRSISSPDLKKYRPFGFFIIANLECIQPLSTARVMKVKLYESFFNQVNTRAVNEACFRQFIR